MKREWSLDELVALFPSRVPDPEGAVVHRPTSSAPGRGRFTDEEASIHAVAEVMLSVGPAPEFKVRLGHSWPEGIQETQRRGFEHGLLLGIFKAAGSLSLPSVLGSCEVASYSVLCDAETTERAVHVAALRATNEALGACEWTIFTAPFPDVAVKAGEDLESALTRACQAFRAVGYDAYDEGHLLSARAREFTRVFVIRIFSPKGSYAHYFFVCPFPWSESSTAEIEKVLASLPYMEGRETGYGTRYHFLSAYSVPRSLSTRHDVY